MAEHTAQVKTLLEANPQGVADIIKSLKPVQEDVLRQIRQYWNQTGQLDWYVTKEIQTMAIVRGPVTFSMSCPEIGKEATLIDKQIKCSFAIGMKGVTVAEFKRFLDAEGTTNENISAYNLDDDGPMLGVNWFEAAQYCNWLSKQEGLAKCYIQRFDGAMNSEERYLESPGYRLPTGAEWEYACRPGSETKRWSETKRFFGRSETLLREYGWYLDNSDGHAWSVGQLKPNDLGLFDIYGNAVEWSQDREGIGYLGQQMDDPYLRRRQLRPEDDEQDAMLSVTIDTARILRGGSFNDRHSALISGGPLPYMVPGARMVQFGFRVAKTLPSGTKQ